MFSRVGLRSPAAQQLYFKAPAIPTAYTSIFGRNLSFCRKSETSSIKEKMRKKTNTGIQKAFVLKWLLDRGGVARIPTNPPIVMAGREGDYAGDRFSKEFFLETIHAIHGNEQCMLDSNCDFENLYLHKNHPMFFLASMMDEKIFSDKNVMLKAVQENPFWVKFASNSLQDDDDIVYTAMEKANVSKYINARYLTNKKFIFHFAGRYKILSNASKECQNDFNIVIKQVQKFPLELRHASPELKNNREIVLKAVRANPYALKYASRELQNDRQVVINAMCIGFWAYEFASEALKSDPKIKNLYFDLKKAYYEFANIDW